MTSFGSITCKKVDQRISHTELSDHVVLLFSNLDPFTETYGLNFYLQYLTHWPEYFQVAEAPNGDIMGYSTYSFCVF